MKQELAAAMVVAIAVLAGPGASGQEVQPESFFNIQEIRALQCRGDTILIGTNGGLVAYDLIHDRIVWDLTVLDGLPSNSVRSMVSFGSLVYVGTDDGLCLFDPASMRIVRSWRGNRFRRLRALELGEDDRVFVGTYGRGAAFLRHGRLRYFIDADSILGGKVLSLLKLQDGPLYFATSKGLFSLQDTLWTGYQAGYGIPRGEIGNLLPAGDGGVYLTIRGKGVYLLKGRRALRLGAPDRFRLGDVAAIALGEDGSLWAAGRYGGIARYRYGFWSGVGEDDPEIETSRWRCATADSEGTLFFGSASGLLLEISRDGIWKRRLESPIPPGSTGDFAQDSTESVFLSCGGRLVRFGHGAFSTVDVPGPVFSIASSPEGGLFVATRWGIFVQKAEGGFEELSFPRDLSDDYPVCIAAPGGEDLWMATAGGAVYSYRDGLFLRMGDPEEVGAGYPKKLLVDDMGRQWVMGGSGKVSLFDGLGWRIHRDSVFSGEPPVLICRGEGGTPLVATRSSVWRFGEEEGWGRLYSGIDGEVLQAVGPSGGRWLVVSNLSLIFVDGASWEKLSRRRLLGWAVVSDIFEDREGFVWFGMVEGGVVRVPRAVLERILFE